MKWVIFWLSILMCVLIGNLIAVSSYDYFWDLEEQRCEKVMQLDYGVATDKVSKCLSYEVSEFWEYTIMYYVLTHLLLLILLMITAFPLAMWLDGMY